MSTTTISSPWGKPKVVTPCSLEDVMSEQASEQLASRLQNEENRPESHLSVSQEPEGPKGAAAAAAATEQLDDAALAAMLATTEVSKGNTGSDEMIARLLQLQFDREHNTMLDVEAKKFNGSSKVSISFENYKTSHPHYEAEEEEDEESYDFEMPKTSWEEGRPTMGRTKGYSGSGKNITTKHDKVICGRKNAERLMEFPPEFESGDGEGMDMQLPNKVYNSLKMHSMSESKRGSRHSEKKEHSTAEHVMDPKTRILLFKLVNRGVLDSIGGVIAGGKESLVFKAQGGRIESMEVPEEVVVKVFKTTLMDFRTREKYVHGDHRFSRDDYKKQNPRKIIGLWAMKEVANLLRMKKFNVPCPSVITLKQHVLVMSMIGKGTPAPKLRYANLSTADLQDAYEQTVAIMKKLHRECYLVHADLSDYNLLWHDGRLYVIDVSQSVDLTHPQAFHFLYRDCCNVSMYFQKQGVHGVLSTEQLFNEVTELDIKGEGVEFSTQVQRYDKERRESNMLLGTSYSQFSFDYHFDRSQNEKEATPAPGTSPSRRSLSAIVQKYIHDPDETSDDDEGWEEVDEDEEEVGEEGKETEKEGSQDVTS